MIAVDTSVAVAAFAGWHEAHADAQAAVAREGRLVAHCALETYSVLTRLPHPHRTAPPLAREFLRRRFSLPLLTLPEEAHQNLIDDLGQAGVSAGAVYDGLVALTARAARATLVSLDHRALPTYERCGARVELIG